MVACPAPCTAEREYDSDRHMRPVQYCVRVHVQSTTGQTPLSVACSQGFNGIVESLLIHGANASDPRVWALLHLYLHCELN